MRKYNRFSSHVARNSMWESKLKNFAFFNFYLWVPAFLVDFSAQKSAQFNTEAKRDNTSRLILQRYLDLFVADKVLLHKKLC